MSKIAWAPGALNDIDAIAEYISRDSIYHASLFIDRLCEPGRGDPFRCTRRSVPNAHRREQPRSLQPFGHALFNLLAGHDSAILEILFALLNAFENVEMVLNVIETRLVRKPLDDFLGHLFCRHSLFPLMGSTSKLEYKSKADHYGYVLYEIVAGKHVLEPQEHSQRS